MNPREDVAVRKPLYLCAKDPTSVDLDGPALLVSAKHHANARYPLARISRVISSTSIEWRTKALVACLKHGIPVVLTGSENTPVGYVLPPVRASSNLDKELEEFLDRPDWQEHYNDWLRVERVHQFIQWQRSREESGKPLAQDELRELKRRYVYLDERTEALAQDGLVAAAIRAAVAERLCKAGLRATYWGFRGEALELLEDVSRLLELMLQLEWHNLRGIIDFDRSAILRVFHTFTLSLTNRCDAILGRLHHHLKALLEEWH